MLMRVQLSKRSRWMARSRQLTEPSLADEALLGAIAGDAAQLGVEVRLLPVFDAPNSREWRGPRLDFRGSPASKLPSPAEPQNGFRCNEIICGKFMA